MTTEVAFHFNVGETARDKLHYACRLVRKALGTGARLGVVGPDATLREFDRLLWTFSALEFVPHCHVDDAAPDVLAASPVRLGTSADTVAPADVLLNLGDAMPQGFDAFTRVIEIVSLEEADRQAARQRWRRYTDGGHAITRHDLAAAGAG